MPFRAGGVRSGHRDRRSRERNLRQRGAEDHAEVFRDLQRHKGAREAGESELPPHLQRWRSSCASRTVRFTEAMRAARFANTAKQVKEIMREYEVSPDGSTLTITARAGYSNRCRSLLTVVFMRLTCRGSRRCSEERAPMVMTLLRALLQVSMATASQPLQKHLHAVLKKVQ